MEVWMRLQRAWVLLVITAITLLFALATGHPMFWRSFYVLAALLVIAAAWVLIMGLGVDVEVRRLSLRASAGGSIQERVLVKRRSGLQKGWLELTERTTMPAASPPAPALTLPEAISTNIGTGAGVKPDNPAPNWVVLDLKTNTGIQPSPTLTPTPPQRQRP